MLKKIFSLKVWLPVLILGLGVGITYGLIKSKPKARKRVNFQKGTLVETMNAVHSDPFIEVETQGKVQAANKVVLSARMGGEVIWISENFSEGRFFKKGEHLLSVGTVQSQSKLKAAFNGVVETRYVDLGQYVNPGMQLATLIGSDQVEIMIDLPMGRIDWLPENFSISSNTSGSQQLMIPAEISLTGISNGAKWPAIINRQLPSLTPKGMMVQLVAVAEDPFRLNAKPPTKKEFSARKKTANIEVGIKNSDAPNQEMSKSRNEVYTPLFVGAFVNVTIPGRQLKNVVKIPAQALRDQDSVWIATAGIDPENSEERLELEVRRIEIAHLDQDSVYISRGLNAGEKIITSPIKGAANGLKIRFVSQGTKGDKKSQFKKREEGKRRRPQNGDGKSERRKRRDQNNSTDNTNDKEA